MQIVTGTISPEELYKADLNQYFLVDLRGDGAYRLGHIPGAVCMEKEDIFSRAGEILSTGKTIVFYCMYGINSEALAEELAEKFEKSRKGSGKFAGMSEGELSPAHCAACVKEPGTAGGQLLSISEENHKASVPEKKVIGENQKETAARILSLAGGWRAYLVYKVSKDAQDATRREEIEKSLRKKFRKEIMSPFVQAITRYELISPGDHIAVCISGGKDSMVMAKCFQEIKRRNKIPFELTFLCMDPGYSEETLGMIRGNAELLGIPLTMFQTNIFDAVYDIEKSPCYLCARMRRGYLYKKAQDLHCNKIALAHHYDDVIETTLLSILFSGQTQTMMPKLKSDNFAGMELIRPMYLVREEAVKHFRDYNGLQFIRCACRFTNTCSVDEANPAATGDTASKRLFVKRLIAEMKESNPSVEANIFRSMENIHLSAILGYKDREKEYHSFLDEYDG